MTPVAQHFGIKNILWRVADHFNHVHVDFSPAGSGTPQCFGGHAGWEGVGGSPALKMFRVELQPDPNPKAPGGIGYFGRISGTYDLGTYVCKKISGTNEWSQHAYDNAQDIGVPDLATGDRVVAWLGSKWTEEDDVSVQDVKDGLVDAFGVKDEAALSDGIHTLLGIKARMVGDPRPLGTALSAGWDFADDVQKVKEKLGA